MNLSLAPLSTLPAPVHVPVPEWAICKAMDGKGFWYYFAVVPTFYDSTGVWASCGRVQATGEPRGDGTQARYSFVMLSELNASKHCRC